MFSKPRTLPTRIFRAVEWEVSPTGEFLRETGTVRYHQCPTAKDAVDSVLYTARLKDGSARVGPSGRVVYTNGRAYAIVPDKR
jgi:hypothetical protein